MALFCYKNCYGVYNKSKIICSVKGLVNCQLHKNQRLNRMARRQLVNVLRVMVKTIVFDKTGILTVGRPSVTDIIDSLLFGKCFSYL
jgi:hypothetical protein